MKQATFYGRVYVSNGRPKIEIQSPDTLAAQVLETMGGPCRIRVVFIEDERERKPWVQKYYWGVVVPKIMAGVRAQGNDWNRDETHQHLKRELNQGRSTGMLTTEEFCAYIERCCQFAAEFLGVYVAPPTFVGTEHYFPQTEQGHGSN